MVNVYFRILHEGKGWHYNRLSGFTSHRKVEKYTNTGQGMSASTDQLGVTRASVVSVFASSDDLEGREGWGGTTEATDRWEVQYYNTWLVSHGLRWKLEIWHQQGRLEWLCWALANTGQYKTTNKKSPGRRFPVLHFGSTWGLVQNYYYTTYLMKELQVSS